MMSGAALRREREDCRQGQEGDLPAARVATDALSLLA